MTIIEQAKGLADKVLAQPATEHDIAVVERQLGRYPRGMVAVGARCVCGRPAGYERAHELYLAFRHEIALALEDSEEHIEGTSAGGMPVRVKCLHALLAQTLVMGEGANPIGDMALSAIKHEFDPAVCRCAVENEE